MTATTNEKFTRADIRAEERAPGMSPKVFWQLYNMAKKKGAPVPIFKSAKVGNYGGQWMHPDGTIRKVHATVEMTEDGNAVVGELAMNPYVTMMVGFVMGVSMTALGFILADPCNWVS